MTRLFSYGAWDGTQHVLDLDAESLLDAMSDDLLEEGDLWRALQRLFRQGTQNQDGQKMPGLQDLLQQLRQRRQQQLQHSNLGDTLKDVREKLQQIQQTERQGIDNKVSDGKQRAEQGEIPEQLQKTMERMAQEHLQKLDQLPPDVPGQIQELQNYDFMDPNARQMFQELMEQLRQQVMQQQFQGMQQAMQSMTPEDLKTVKDMLHDLNQMLDEKARGGEPDFSGFMDKWGQFFPGVKSLEELIERQLGEAAKDQLDQLDQIAKLLEEAGLVERNGDHLELTPRAIRKIGQKALRDIFQHLTRDRFGNHEADHRGRGGDRSDDTKAYEF